ncbi:MAG: hypothetical protein PHW04_12930 [Candidatus Wallbacteria bacterium]|nr:hypothetical protein [Candidatus Wallbacteria bacterium]
MWQNQEFIKDEWSEKHPTSQKLLSAKCGVINEWLAHEMNRGSDFSYLWRIRKICSVSISI